MMEERSLLRRPDYARVMESVSMLVPWPRKKITLESGRPTVAGATGTEPGSPGE